MSLISCHPAIKYFTEIVDFKSFLKFVCPLFSFPKVHLGNKHCPNPWIHVSQSDHSNYLLLYFILLKRILWNNIRSSHRMCPTEKAVLLKISQYSQEKHLCWNLILIKLQARSPIKRRFQHRCFPVNIAKFLRIPNLEEICESMLEAVYATVKYLNETWQFQKLLKMDLSVKAFLKRSFNYTNP